MANNVKYVIDDGKNKFAAYDAESVDSLLDEKVNNAAFNSAVEELEGEIEQKANTDYVNEEIARIETIIEDLPEPMIFKGTLGTGGTIQELPTASASNEGFTYKVITDGTYAGQSARVGDVFISNGSEWVLVPAGDDFNDTWRAIKVNGTEVLNNAISSGAVNFNEGDQLTITFDAETKTLNFNVVNTYTKQEVDEIIYNVLPDGTANGAVANFNTSLQLPIKSMQIDVNAKQDLHGYANPWTAGNGKNKCSMENETFIQFKEVEINEIPAGDYVFSSIITSNDTDSDKCAIVFLDENKNTLASKTIDRSVGNARVSTNFSVSTPIKFIRLYAASGFPSGAGDTATYSDNMICLQSASNPTAFEPYENICPIEGWNEISLPKCGANLCDEVFELGSIDNQTGQNANNPNYYRSKNYIQVPKGVNLYLVNGNSDTLGLRFYDSNKAFIGARAFLTSKVMPYGTYDLPTGTTYIRIVNTSTNVYANNISLNYPSTDTTYHSYNGNTEVIELGGTYYGGYFMQDNDGHRQFVITHRFATFNQREVFKSGTWDGEKGAFWYATKSGQGFEWSALSTNYGVITDKFVMLPNINNTSTIGGMTWFTNGIIRWIDIKTMNMSIEEYKNYLNENPINVVYPLTTPIIIDLPDGEPINTFNGINNFFADSGDTTVTFKQSVNDAINAALNAANNNRMLGMINMSKGNESEENEETKEDLNEESNEK